MILISRQSPLPARDLSMPRSWAIEVFLDGPNAKPRDAVHVLFAGEKVRPDYAAAAPAVSESEKDAEFQVLGLEPLVRMKLTSFRRKDQVHLQDLIGVGLIDAAWPAIFPPLEARLHDCSPTRKVEIRSTSPSQNRGVPFSPAARGHSFRRHPHHAAKWSRSDRNRRWCSGVPLLCQPLTFGAQ